MKNPVFIEDLVAGSRVAFINSIRSDIPSGGNTATAKFLETLKPVCELRVVSLTPRTGNGSALFARLLFLIESFPAPLVIYLSRRYHAVWLEFFLRLSPIYLVRCLWLRMAHRPDYVFFNQHSTFIYTIAFAGCKRVFVWHDVPSFKRDASASARRSAACCGWLERRLVATSNYNVTFSFDDRKILRRLHQRNAFVIPVIANDARPRAPVSAREGMLLIGNWSRVENSEGAARFFEAYADQSAMNAGDKPVASFHVAGHGAASFVSELRENSVKVRGLSIRATARYGDIRQFPELVLLAPVLRGAGIKLKTIEAWSCGIAVIGTRQAFTGLPASIWKVGGIRMETLEAMARLCADPAALARACGQLDPSRAFQMYHAAILANAHAAASTAETVKN